MRTLLGAHVGHHLAVVGVETGAVDVSQQAVVGVEHRQHVGVSRFELLHHVLHGVVHAQGFRGRCHELSHLEMVVKLGAEHQVADVVDVHFAQQLAGIVEHGQYAGVASADGMDEFAQPHVGRNGGELTVDDAVEVHQGEHCPVGMVGDEFALARQPHAVDAVWLEHDDDQIGTHTHDDERNEQPVSTRDFGNEENARQRGVHHAGHHAGHAQKREVLLGDIDSHLISVPQAGKEETAEGSDEQRRGERTATSSTAVGGRGGKNLGEQHHGNVEHEQVAVAVEQRVVHHCVPVGFGLSVQQDVDAVVAFAIERGEKENQGAQHQSAQGELGVGLVLEAFEHPLAGRHGAYEVETHQPTDHAEQYAGGYSVDEPLFVECEMKQRVSAYEQVGEAGGRDTGDEDGQQRGHGQVDHEHLEGEHQSGDGSLEDAGNGCRGATSHEQHDRFAVHLERLCQVGANGRTREHDGSLGTHRTAETDGDGRSDDRRPAVVAWQSRALRRNGVKNAGDAVRDVVLHHVAHKERGEIDANDGIDQIEPVERRVVESGREQQLDFLDEPVQNKSSHCCKEANGQCEQ